MKAIVDLLWNRIPQKIAFGSPTLAFFLTDGFYLCAWNSIAFLVLPVSFLTGFIWASIYGIYSYSLIILGVMAVIGAFGSALGAWLTVGYVVGFAFIFTPEGYIGLITSRPGALILYALLAVLVVIVPSLSDRFATLCIPSSLKSKNLHLLFRIGALLLFQGAFVYAWTQTAAVLIRPVWAWTSNTPPVAGIAPLQETGWLVACLAMGARAIRVVLETRALMREGVSAQLRTLQSEILHQASMQKPLPSWISIIGKSAVLTVFLAGMLTTWLQAVTLYIALVLILFFRQFISHRCGIWVSWMTKVPLIIRLVIWFIGIYYFSNYIVEHAWYSTNDFSPILIISVTGSILFTLLLPIATQSHK